MGQGDCIFCRIVAGEIPAAVVFQDETCAAFLDIGPVAEGHTLLISADHVETIDGLSDRQAAGVLGKLPALVKAVQAATGCEGVNVLQNNGEVAGQLVRHVHFHIIPRNAGDAFDYNWPAGKYPQGRAAELAEAIRRELA